MARVKSTKRGYTTKPGFKPVRENCRRKKRPAPQKAIEEQGDGGDLFQDDEALIIDLAERIEARGIEWYGIDMSLETSLGEYMTYFPNHNMLTMGEEYEYFYSIAYNFSDLEELVADAIDSHGESIASFMGTSVFELQQELSDARNADELLLLIFSIEQYNGAIFEGEYPMPASEFVRMMNGALGLQENAKARSNEELIEIPEDVQIPGTDVILEAGDTIRVFPTDIESRREEK